MMGLTLFKVVVVVMLSAMPAWGHVVEQIFFSFKNDGRSWELTATFDAAYSLPELRDDPGTPQPQRQWLLGKTMVEHQRMQQGAEAYLRQSLMLSYAGKVVPYRVSFPDYDASPPQFPRLLNGGAYFTVNLSGEIQEATAGKLRLISLPGTRPDLIVALKSVGETHYLVVSPGGEEVLYSLDASGKSTSEDHGMRGVLWLGYRHVLPDGFDHVLFILALFLMARKWRPLVSQSLAFTLAHSISLGWVVSGGLQIQQWPVAWLIEPFIAASIAIVAIENMFVQHVGGRRLTLVFVLGLVHGLGFAGSLGVALVHQDGWLMLVLANLGVELAQITLLAGAWCMTLGWWSSVYYPKFCRAASMMIAVVGVCWACQRLFIGM
ncbi:MAG: HupE/UreJ family protein [Verrucomicrobiae bacterium]|nr:HupE/UreJ family protein [Verrucomicrobiae bacterium]NNJ44352.1 hypothetical protein [Akkermansiaceae bacterium]